MRMIFTGSREWGNPWMVEEHLKEIRGHFDLDEVTIVHGDHWAGLDKQVDLLARRLGFTVEPHAAKWRQYGRAAGPIRNAEMVDAGAGVCFGFKDGFDTQFRRGGTENCVDLALRAGIACEVRASDGTLYVLPSEPGRAIRSRSSHP